MFSSFSIQKEAVTYFNIASAFPSAVTVIAHAFVGYRFTVNGRAIFALVKKRNNSHIFDLLKFFF